MGDRLRPVDLGSGKKAVALSAGWSHTCALLEDGAVKCWGFNANGELGQGDADNRGDEPDELGAGLPPIDLGSGKKAVALATGAGHTCAILDDGSVKCRGYTADGELGLGDTQNHGDEPGEMGDKLPTVDLGPGETATAIAAGSSHTCALFSDGGVKCWGRNIRGQLGVGDLFNRGDEPDDMGAALSPVDLGNGKRAVAIAGGLSQSCALLDDGTVKCWGSNDWGKLGQGDMDDRGDEPGEPGDSLPPIDLGTGQKATAITAGTDHGCALLVGGDMKCWGANYSGQLGVGDSDWRGDAPGQMGNELPAIVLCGADP